MATAPKNLVSNCRRNSSRLNVFGESSDGESGVVDQNVDLPVVAKHGFCEPGDGVEFRDIQDAHVDLSTAGCGRLVEFSRRARSRMLANPALADSTEVSSPKPLDAWSRSLCFQAWHGCITAP